MTEEKQKDYSVGNLNVVVVKKDELLAKLKENRDLHNTIFEAAVSGYWIEAQKVLEKKKEEFKDAVTKSETIFSTQVDSIRNAIKLKDDDKIDDFRVGFSYNGTWPLTYPENHLEDYERTINMLEFSIADKVELSCQDFDAYVRNNWAWKKNFMASNVSFANNYMCAVSGCIIDGGGNNESVSTDFKYSGISNALRTF